MTINYTTLLGLAEPVTGTESGTWGDDVNKGITEYLDIAIAGTQTISGSQTAVTLSLTNGSSAGNNIAQAGTGGSGSAQYAIINCTGNPASLLTITVPASSKTYIVINATSTSQSVKIVGAGPTTGVTIPSGGRTIVAWNGSDFVEVTKFGSLTVLSADATIYGITVGRGAGAVSTNTAVGASALAGSNSGTGQNVGVGRYALTSNTTGADNTAVGHTSGWNITTGSYNVSIGSGALQANTTASSNTAVGYQAGYANTAGLLTALGASAGRNYNSSIETWGSLFVGVNSGTSTTAGANNVVVGHYALRYNETGSNNTAIGAAALYGVPSNSASGNTAIGYQAAYSNTTGSALVAVGASALAANTTGLANTGIGYQTLAVTVTGSSNTAVGYQAGNSNTGSNNTYIGAGAGSTSTSAINSVAIGNNALGVATSTGESNIAIGFNVLRANTSGIRNTAVGGDVSGAAYGAMAANTTGSNNSAYGVIALVTNTTGSYNVALGGAALQSNTTGVNNTAVGFQAGNANTTGNYSTFVGYRAGYLNTTGMNTCFGYQAGFTNSTGNNNLCIGASAGYNSTSGQNTLIGNGCGFSVTSGTGNTFIGSGVDGSKYPSGYFMTTGSKNTILGNFDGNGGNISLDMRTLSNRIALSDGDGVVRIYSDQNGNVGINRQPNYFLDIYGNATGNGRLIRNEGARVLYRNTFAENLSGTRTLRFWIYAYNLQFVNIFFDIATHRYDNGGNWQQGRYAVQFMAEGSTVRLNQRMTNYEYAGVATSYFTFPNPPSWTFSGGWWYFDLVIGQYATTAGVSIRMEGPGAYDAYIEQVA